MKKFLIVGMFVAMSVTPVFALEPTMAAKRAEIRTEFKESMQKLKDERKRLIVQKTYNMMCEVQKKRTAVMTNNLNKMTQVLARVSTKAETLSAEKKAPVTSAVTAAQTAITEANTAVKALSERKCEFTLSGNEATLKTEVAAARTALENEVKTVHTKVEAARKAVTAAVKALAEAYGKN